MKQAKKAVEKVSKIKLNVNFIEFVGKVIEQKLLTKDAATLRKMYIETVKVKSAININRVADRTTRSELRLILEKVLKAKGIGRTSYKVSQPSKALKKREAFYSMETDAMDMVVFEDDLEVEADMAFYITEEMPRFKGGDLTEFQEYIQEHIKYPEEALLL